MTVDITRYYGRDEFEAIPNEKPIALSELAASAWRTMALATVSYFDLE